MKLWPLTANPRRRSRSSKPAATVRPNPEAAAYLMVERARGRVSEMSELGSERAGEQLDGVRRELGMVGYLVSENLVGEARRELRAQAEAACRRTVSKPETARAELADLLAQVGRELERAITVPELSDHVVQAAEHLARARELLTGPRGERAAPTAASGVDS
jgi:hypothetical protein